MAPGMTHKYIYHLCRLLAKNIYPESIHEEIKAVFHEGYAGCAFFFFFSFWPQHEAWEFLVPPPGIQSRTTAAKTPSPNHLTSREFPSILFPFKFQN